MEATATYPQWPPVLVSAGLGGAVAAASPDVVPLKPALINDPRRRGRFGGIDCVGILRECYRNIEGYNYMRPLKRAQFKGSNHSGEFAQYEATFFDRRNRELLPRDMTIPFLQEAIRRERETETPQWQGNALAGIQLADRDTQLVFFPTGPILQQACMYHSSQGGGGVQRRSNVVECGAIIRQFELLGCQELYEMYNAPSVMIVARGAANCTILSASVGEETVLKAEHRLRFDHMVYHVAGSPHTDSDAAFITGDGKFHTWNPGSETRSLDLTSVPIDERLLRCEYSSNPCVLWVSNRTRVQNFDLREPQPSSSTSLFDLVKMNASHSEIYALRRRSRCPFHLIVGTSVSLELLDARMPGKALLSWQQRHEADRKAPHYGLIDEIFWSDGANSDTGLCVSSVQGRKTLSLYPFTRLDNDASSFEASPFLSVRTFNPPKKSHGSVSQYIVEDSPLDLQLRDGSEWTTLLGACVLRDNLKKSKAKVYQLNSFGDLFCQQIQRSGESAAQESSVQSELPCGVTTRSRPGHAGRRQLPIPVDAIQGEHATEEITPFVALPVKAFVNRFPRLPLTSRSGDITSMERLASPDTFSALRLACHPSATLFRLHRFANDILGIRVTTNDLLHVLRSHSKFQVQVMRQRFRQQFSMVLNPYPESEAAVKNRENGDGRLSSCSCCLTTSSEPCESVACLLPHAILVTSSAKIHVQTAIQPNHAGESSVSSEFQAILEQAREVYGMKE